MASSTASPANIKATYSGVNVMVTSPSAACEWYERVLDARVQARMGDTYVMIVLPGGLSLGLCQAPPGAAKPGQDGSYSVCIGVADVDASVALLEAKGVQFTARVESHGAKMAFFGDQDGNALYLSQVDPSAFVQEQGQAAQSENAADLSKRKREGGCTEDVPDAKRAMTSPEGDAPQLSLSYAIVDVPATVVLTRRDKVPKNALGEWFGQALPATSKEAAAKGIKPVGPPLALYHCGENFNEDDPFWDVEAGCPVSLDGVSADVQSSLHLMRVGGGKALKASYHGAYDGLKHAWKQAIAHAAAEGHKLDGDGWEQYMTDPMCEPNVSKWLTDIYLPLV